MEKDVDSIEAMEREDTKTKLPAGWLLLFIGLIVWGIFYSFSYTPQVSGWSQEKQYMESVKQ